MLRVLNNLDHHREKQALAGTGLPRLKSGVWQRPGRARGATHNIRQLGY